MQNETENNPEKNLTQQEIPNTYCEDFRYGCRGYDFTEDPEEDHLFNLMQRDGFLDSIKYNINISQGELLLVVLKYCARNNLPITQIARLTTLINLIFSQPVLPSTKHLLDKLFKNKNRIEYHKTCKECASYLGVLETIQTDVCSNCNVNIDLSDSASSGLFALIDPSQAISEYSNTYEEYYRYIVSERLYRKGNIQDIYDGKCYRDFVKSLPDNEKESYVSVLFNTDGAAIFKSSSNSVWPIYLVINELPPEVRFKHAIICGVWFGETKPVMNLFLDKFVDLMNGVLENGIPTIINGENRHIKCYPILATVDTPARSEMNCTKQFNGKNGCDWCLHPTEYSHGATRYPILPGVRPRSKEETLANMIRIVEEGIDNIDGVTGFSPLCPFSKFDIIQGFTPDLLHCVCIGVGKRISRRLVKTIPKTKNSEQLLDQRLKLIQANSQLKRLTRPWKENKHWKGMEWLNWILYYSIPVLTGLCSQKYLDYWTLFTDSVYVLISTEITHDQLRKVDEKFRKFLCLTQDYFGKGEMTYNLHQLIHMPKSVYNWGPSWAHCTFPFESENHYIVKGVFSARGVVNQVIRHTGLRRAIKIVEKHVHPIAASNIITFIDNIKYPRTKKCFAIGSITLYNENISLKEKLHLPSTARVFTRLVKSGCLYTSCQVVNKRSCNFFAKLKNGNFIKIVAFVLYPDRNVVLIYKQLSLMGHQSSNYIQKCINIARNIQEVGVCELMAPAIFVRIKYLKYIVAIPNLFHYSQFSIIKSM